jgi:hypothetical protein
MTHGTDIVSARIYLNFPTCKHFRKLTFLSIFARGDAKQQGSSLTPLEHFYNYIMEWYNLNLPYTVFCVGYSKNV